jgi:protein-tyrosine phosphatase
VVTPVIPQKLYRAARPGYSGEGKTPVGMGEIQGWIEAAQSHGVASIICLLDDEHLCLYPDSDLVGIYQAAGFEVRHVPARDHCIPPLTSDQLNAVLLAYRDLPKPVLIHCSAGLGRTGVAWAHIIDHEN